MFIPLREQSTTRSVSSLPTISPSPLSTENDAANQQTDLVQNTVVPSKQLELEQTRSSPRPPLDDAAVEIHRKMILGLNAKIRGETRTLYGAAFEQLGLTANQQEKVIDILTQQQKRLEQQAFEAARSGSLPTPPSLEAIREQQSQQDQELRSVLGDAAFAQFNEYRAAIPDRIVIGQMNQEGANLSESQSQQLLQILTQARQQIIGQSGITQNLASMLPEQAMTAIQQQEASLAQTVTDRTQNILTPDQTTLLQSVLSHRSVQKPSP
jgi:nicotinic acid mononucleotide adenylyltransferase